MPEFVPAAAAGRAGAAVTDALRELRRCVARYPGLLPTDIFDVSMLAAIAMANVFAAPWLDAARHRSVNRAALWTFALDRWVDGQPATAAAVAAFTDEAITLVCAAPGGPVPADPLLALLLEIRDDLMTAPGWAQLHPVWVAELRRMLEAMGRERAWLEAGRQPSARAYLANANSLAFVFVFATHVVAVCTPPRPAGLARLFQAARVAQRALRLANDLATHARDVALGDLNVLGLGVGRAAVEAEIGRLAQLCRHQLGSVRAQLPRLSTQVERQLEYNLSFYAVGDYWAVDPVGRADLA